jgi:hypothetical protein
MYIDQTTPHLINRDMCRFILSDVMLDYPLCLSTVFCVFVWNQIKLFFNATTRASDRFCAPNFRKILAE